MPLNGPRPLLLGAVGALGGMLLLLGWLDERRPRQSELAGTSQLKVTSPEDSGPGSLREAILAANVADDRPRITIHTPIIRLRTLLPPVAHPRGLALASAEGVVEIDATDAPPGVVLDLVSPRVALTALAVRGAADTAIRVRGENARLAGVEIRDCGTGVHALAGASGMVVEGSRFERNDLGVRVEFGGGGTVRTSTFEDHAEAAIWAVQGEPAGTGRGPALVLAQNRSRRDRMGLVLGNLPIIAEGNEITGALEAAVYVFGQGVIVRRNRVRDGERMGILAIGADGALIADNEVDRNQGVGILVNSSTGTSVQSNQTYLNGHGLVTVFGAGGGPNVLAGNGVFGQRYDGVVVIGGAPVLRGNTLRGNGGAALRVLDYIARDGERTRAQPLIEVNAFEGNGSGEVVRGEYREPPPEASS